MKATEANLLGFLQSPKQLIIPIYQRTYSWTRKECDQLWNDIHRAANNADIEAHFVGSIVYIAKGIYQATGIPQLLVIDGQQRITTLSLLITALARAMERGGKDAKKLYNYYLINQEEEDELYYKLVLTRSDKEALFKVIEGIDIPEQSSHRVFDNYRYFERLIQEKNLDFDMLYTGISKLLIVDVSLDRRYDNPQLIFESLNSTGLDLSQADLIRNFILMGLEPKVQEDLYKRFWFPMESSFGIAEYTTLFDRFMRDFLTIKSDLGSIPVINQVYGGFKTYVRQIQNGDVESIVADIHHYSKYFVRLAFPQDVEDSEIRGILQDIKTLKVDVAYPFLIEVYDDYERHKRLTREEFVVILKIVESYVFRRAICGIPTNSLNKTFATLKRVVDKSRYLESVKAAFLMMDSYRRFPRDEEFWDEFTRKDVYNLTRRNYLLSKLENYGRKEYVNVENYTIEHIMPQNPKLSGEWQGMLGKLWQEIQARYLHTIGNLTLTGYNSELSDRSFLNKRDMEGGFRDSPFRLNRSLAKLETWGEKQIQDRADELAELALKVWPCPTLPEDVLAQYGKPAKENEIEEYTLERYEQLKGTILDLFQAIRTRILNLDSSVREEYKKRYIAYKATTNFVDIVPTQSRLRLSLNMGFDEINDPKGICEDYSNKGHWGNGDIEFSVYSVQDIEYAMFLIRQAYKLNSEDFAM